MKSFDCEGSNGVTASADGQQGDGILLRCFGDSCHYFCGSVIFIKLTLPSSWAVLERVGQSWRFFEDSMELSWVSELIDSVGCSGSLGGCLWVPEILRDSWMKQLRDVSDNRHI